MEKSSSTESTTLSYHFRDLISDNIYPTNEIASLCKVLFRTEFKVGYKYLILVQKIKYFFRFHHSFLYFSQNSLFNLSLFKIIREMAPPPMNEFYLESFSQNV